MKPISMTVLALALVAAFPASAQSMADVLKELQDLKAKVADLEGKLKAQDAKQPQWGMTPEQSRELSRVAVKAEAMEDSRDAAGFKLLKISGYADPTYLYNRAQKRGGFQFLNSVGSDGYNYDNSYFGTVALDFQKETDSGTKWRLTLMPNRGTDAVIGNGGIVQEASVSVPLTDLQTRLFAGHIPDWSGYEYLPSTQNKLITHNLLFDFTLPTAYTGAGVETVSGKWIVKGMLANMNKTLNQSGERAPVIAYRADYSRGEFQGFGFAGVHGKATNFANCLDVDCTSFGQSTVNLLEVDGYFVRGDWTVQGQVSYGTQKDAAITPDPNTGDLRDSRWYGLSALAAYKFSPRFEGIVRFDWLNNKKNGGGLLGYTGSDGRNGIGPGMMSDGAGGWVMIDPEVGVNRTALSLGLSYLFDSNTTFKAEYRLDRASQPVFFYASDGGYRKSNSVLGASVVVSF